MTHDVGALEEGASNSRCIVFDQAGRPAAIDQREHRQDHPLAGSAEPGPLEAPVRR
jgi:glycerol kinase